MGVIQQPVKGIQTLPRRRGKVNPDVALDGMPPFEYFCRKQERIDETLIGFTFS